MRLLVTRPEPDCSRTAAKLIARGHHALVQPLLTIAFNAPPADLPGPAALLITSQNAVRAIREWPQTAGWLSVPAFAAGPATARALADAGFTDIREGARDAGSLAEVVIEAMPKDAGPLLYPAARDRAGALAGGLVTRGYDVRMVEAYRADPVLQFEPRVGEALARGGVDGILLYSGRTARVLSATADAEGLTDALKRPEYYVISDHVAGIVHDFGRRVHVAERPDEDSLLALIPAGA